MDLYLTPVDILVKYFCANTMHNSSFSICALSGFGQTVRCVCDWLIILQQACAHSKFNNYFTDIGKNLADKIDTSNKHPFDHYLHSPSISKFHLKQTNPNEIISVINNLPMKTSAGHDKISCIILKEIKDIIAQPLSLLVNQAFNTGVFPSKLKLAKVIPLFKKGDKTSIENYRPISLLPCMSKVLEKIINIQLYDYFQSNNLLYKSQYGFRKHHSTEFASLELVRHNTTTTRFKTRPVRSVFRHVKSF